MGKNRGWTEEEIQYLEDRWGSVSIKGIAKNIDRSVNAVKLKANRLGLGDARMHYDGITINQLSLALDVSYSTIRSWIHNHDFPVKQKLFALEEKVNVVTYKDFWTWAESHKQIIDFSKVEKNILGAEPDWVDIKRGADIIGHRKSTPWTKEEDAQLKSMVNAYQYTYPEIAKALRRTEGAVKNRLKELNIKARPLRLNNNVKYTNEEMDLIVDMYNKGYNVEVIAERIGKSALGVRGKLERMGYRFKNGVPIQQSKVSNQ
ncbi:hypothetical protein [Heyndrickxia sporothermodurans]|uniref:hypothetical protein n=1 Tax=Heyndrickxia sporothermodurans TaxID=46224 RepID=UPI000D3546EB|nr:hypothetical protein [Heyndrickxia sporothermodurans]PTY92909.1 hypothetical protein B5V90_02185 [Heyndrickxia sporothermodurans]